MQINDITIKKNAKEEKQHTAIVTKKGKFNSDDMYRARYVIMSIVDSCISTEKCIIFQQRKKCTSFTKKITYQHT